MTRAVVWAPASGSQPLPTLIFSPGFGQEPTAYSTLLTEWARHGFLVVAIQHPAFADPDNVELYDAGLAITRHLVKALTHILKDRSRTGSPFARMDTARMGVIGHSIGGSAAAQACAWEPRLRACMNLDGTIFGTVVHTGMQQPFFLIRQHFVWIDRDPPRWMENHDQLNLHEDSVWAHTPTMYWLTIQGLDHMDFTDAARSPGVGARVQSAVGLRQGAGKVQVMTSRYVLDFFGHYLNQSPRPPSLNRSPFPRTTLKRKPA